MDNEKNKVNPNVTLNSDGSASIKLTRPMEIDGTKVTSLRMREPTVQDQLEADKSGSALEQESALFANLCMQTPADIRRLTIRDYGRCQEAFGLFLD